MHPTEIARLAVAIALSGVLVWASVSDIRARRIPNASVLAVLALFVVEAIINRGAGLLSSFGAGAIALVVTFALYAFNEIIGAGDAKLFSAAALFAGLAALPALAFATALFGGLVAVVSILTRPRRALVMLQLRGKGDFGKGVPYGVAIAAGTAIVIWAPYLGWRVNLTL